MDKLEFDARLARLERGISFHSALLALILLAAGAAAYMISRPALRETATILSAAPPPPTPVAEANSVAIHDFVDNMRGFAADFRKAKGLLDEGMIDAEDFAAKKAQILAAPVQVLDFAEDIKAAKELVGENILTEQEYASLKKKILTAGR